MAVLVDEYDSFLNSVFGNKEFAHDPEELKKMEFTFAAFFANIKSRLGPNLRVFIAGIAPMVLSMYTSGFGWINLQSRKCIGLFGFTEEGVRMGLGLLDLTPEFSGHLYSRIREYHYGYRFFANSTLTVFNPTRIQFILSKLASACSAGASLAQLEDTLAALPDPNTKPSDHLAHAVIQPSRLGHRHGLHQLAAWLFDQLQLGRLPAPPGINGKRRKT